MHDCGFASFWLNFLAFYEYYHKEMMHKEPALIVAAALHLWILRYHMILATAKETDESWDIFMI